MYLLFVMLRYGSIHSSSPRWILSWQSLHRITHFLASLRISRYPPMILVISSILSFIWWKVNFSFSSSKHIKHSFLRKSNIFRLLTSIRCLLCFNKSILTILYSSINNSLSFPYRFLRYFSLLLTPTISASLVSGDIVNPMKSLIVSSRKKDYRGNLPSKYVISIPNRSGCFRIS